MQDQIPTWSVNSLAQAAGIWITQHYDRLAPSRARLLEDHAQMEKELQSRSIPFVPSATVFTMLRPPQAVKLKNQLWENHRILVRSCGSYGLPDWLRIAARPPTVMQSFWKALDEELSWQN
jgi:histidinol-phosphate/aromatic aminotransferase/cobyric acid decarboxylase-like protein